MRYRGKTEMEEELLRFAEYLKNERRMAHNTLVSYERDLRQMITWLNTQGITRPEKVTDTVLNSYVLWLEREGKATTTISRVVASTKAFFAYEAKKGVIPFNPAESLKAPKVEKKLPTVLTGAEVEAFLQQTQGRTLKKLRDRAMLELLCATGLRVSEIIDLKVTDINLVIGYVNCSDGERERAIPFGRTAQDALRVYLEEGRAQLMKNGESDLLFVNISGSALSRQGFWKIIKYYGDKAGIRKDITPQALRNSFAAHLLRNGTDMRSMQTMLGHSDLSVTHAYVSYINAGSGAGDRLSRGRRR